MIFDTRYTTLLVTALALSPMTLRADDVRQGSRSICDTVEQIDEFIKTDDEGKEPMLAVDVKTRTARSKWSRSLSSASSSTEGSNQWHLASKSPYCCSPAPQVTRSRFP